MPRTLRLCQTMDAAWNACQTLLVSEGYLDPSCCGYWSQLPIAWCPAPVQAVDLCLALLRLLTCYPVAVADIVGMFAGSFPLLEVSEMWWCAESRRFSHGHLPCSLKKCTSREPSVLSSDGSSLARSPPQRWHCWALMGYRLPPMILMEGCSWPRALVVPSASKQANGVVLMCMMPAVFVMMVVAKLLVIVIVVAAVVAVAVAVAVTVTVKAAMMKVSEEVTVTVAAEVVMAPTVVEGAVIWKVIWKVVAEEAMMAVLRVTQQARQPAAHRGPPRAPSRMLLPRPVPAVPARRPVIPPRPQPKAQERVPPRAVPVAPTSVALRMPRRRGLSKPESWRVPQ